jgi:hypothetical protein
LKRDIAHYPDLKDDKGFRIWNRGFVSKAKNAPYSPCFG